MPFESKAQQRFMFAKHPRIAKRWADHTPNFKSLPEKKSAKKIAEEITDLIETEEREEEKGNPITIEEVQEFLRANPAPEDYELHQWAESKGVSPHAAEELIYQFAAQQVTGKEPEDRVEGGAEETKEAAIASYVLHKVAKDQIPGGLADNKPDAKYSPKQIAMGIKVEKEHTPSSANAKEIAKDHLEEFGDYYTHLDKMEKKLEGKKTAAQLAQLVLTRIKP